MGFLGDVGDFLGGAVNTVVKTVTSPKKLTSAILTGGGSVVAPKFFQPLTDTVGNVLYNPKTLQKALSLAGPGKLASGIGLAQLGGFSGKGGTNMGFNLGGLLGGAVQGLGSLLGGGSPSQALQSFTNFLPSIGTPPGFPSTVGVGTYPVAASGQALRGIATVGRSFFNKFPNLATAIQGYRNMGKNITRAKLYSLVKRFGPDVVISGGILSAAAVSELLIAGPGRRRMNPANVKALRRSLRRLESFHHLCARVNRATGHRSRRRSAVPSARATTLIRQG